jgi:hypothetical protein
VAASTRRSCSARFSAAGLGRVLIEDRAQRAHDLLDVVVHAHDLEALGEDQVERLQRAVILFGLMWWLGASIPRAAVAAAGITLFVYVIFGKVLRVPLPLGVFWF